MGKTLKEFQKECLKDPKFWREHYIWKWFRLWYWKDKIIALSWRFKK